MMVYLPPPFCDIPRVSLLSSHLPHIEPLPRLQKALELQHPAIFICREDLNSGLAFGGNKIRKLEYVVQAALQSGADTLVTTGGVQSNHMRQTAATAAHYGLKCVLLPKNMVQPASPELYNSLGNVQINGILGAETLPIDTSEAKAMEFLTKRGDRPYWIPSGASTHPLGGLGYARWVFELSEWEKSNDTFFDAIVVTCGGGSTLAGTIVGNKLAVRNNLSRARRIIGIGIFAKPASEIQDYVLDIARTTATKVGLNQEAITRDDVEVDDRFNAGAYGRLDDPTQQTLRLFARTQGILLDPVYTGKAATGLVAMLREGTLQDTKNVLLVHTGGQASLPAYPGMT